MEVNPTLIFSEVGLYHKEFFVDQIANAHADCIQHNIVKFGIAAIEEILGKFRQVYHDEKGK